MLAHTKPQFVASTVRCFRLSLRQYNYIQECLYCSKPKVLIFISTVFYTQNIHFWCVSPNPPKSLRNTNPCVKLYQNRNGQSQCCAVIIWSVSSGKQRVWWPSLTHPQKTSANNLRPNLYLFSYPVYIDVQADKMRRITVIWTPLLTMSLKLRLVLLGVEWSVLCYVLSGWQQIGFCSAHGHRANDCTLYHTINGSWKPRAYNRNSAVTQQDAYDTQEYKDREVQVSLAQNI